MGSKINLEMAYSMILQQLRHLRKRFRRVFPNNEIVMNPLSLSVHAI